MIDLDGIGSNTFQPAMATLHSKPPYPHCMLECWQHTMIDPKVSKKDMDLRLMGNSTWFPSLAFQLWAQLWALLPQKWVYVYYA